MSCSNHLTQIGHHRVRICNGLLCGNLPHCLARSLPEDAICEVGPLKFVDNEWPVEFLVLGRDLPDQVRIFLVRRLFSFIGNEN